MGYNFERLEKGMVYLGITLSDIQLEQFIRYYESLIEKNRVMNLTAITDFDEVVQKHFIDSLALIKSIDLKHVSSIIDVGTGAGFPGIPLKIVFPSLKVTLMDSLNKRVCFLKDVIEMLNFSGIEALHSRAEDLARDPNYREAYDLSVSRAVANLNSLSEYCLPFVKIDGYFISYKSGKIEDELETGKKAIQILGGRLENVEKFQLPESDISRSLICIKKVKKCSGIYPRKAGMPTSSPL